MEGKGLPRMSRKAVVEELNKLSASDLMVSRASVVLINSRTPFSELIDWVIHDGHSRFPVYSGRIDNIEGILYVKDLLQFFRKEELEFDIKRLLRPPLFVSENKKAGDLLMEFREERVHIAIVVDEYGTMLGIVSMEDILEQIVGSISDEFDEEHEEMLVQEIATGEYRVMPKITIEAFNAQFKTRFSSEHYETIGGYLLDRFGHVPQTGEAVETGGLHFIAEEVQGSRVKSFKVIRD